MGIELIEQAQLCGRCCLMDGHLVKTEINRLTLLY